MNYTNHSILGNIEGFFKQKTVLSNLIAINVLVFLLTKIVVGFGMLFKLEAESVYRFLELPSDLPEALSHPWTFISYMFFHIDFMHILFNLLWLYWFGKIFMIFFNPRQMGGLYFLGGLAGACLYILSYNIFPYFTEDTVKSYLLGASASVMAIVFASAFYKKDFEISLLFLGRLKIIYIAIFSLVIDLLSVSSSNAGGHIAHIGGALVGILFATSIKKGMDITRFINLGIDGIVNLFRKSSSGKKMKVTYNRFETDYEYNKKKNEKNQSIDHILDKIKKSGYSSLTSEEKKQLFDASKQ